MPVQAIFKKKETGFSLIEILIVVAIIMTLASLAMPSFLRARMDVNENAAITSLKTIHKACLMYYGNNNSYPLLGLADLTVDPAYIDSVLGSGNKQGYQLIYVFIDAQHFSVNANPALPGVTGNRYFYIDEIGIIHVSTIGPATAGDPIIE